MLVQFFRAVAVATRPGLGSILVKTVLSVVGVLDAFQFEVFLPIGALLVERRGKNRL
jgi:hypothetical protein